MTWIIQVTPLAETELMAMPADIQARFVHIAEMIQEFGPHAVGLPHVRFLQDKLWEMRLKGRDNIARAIYVAQTGKRLRMFLFLLVFILPCRVLRINVWNCSYSL